VTSFPKDIAVHPLRVRGVTVDVFLRDDGQFLAPLASGLMLRADTRAGLAEVLDLHFRDASAGKVSVRFAWMNPAGRVRHGTAYGVHGGNRNIMVRWDDGKTEQTDGEGALAAMTPDEAAKWETLRKAQMDAAVAYREFTQPRMINLRGLVADAMRAAAGA
jgi:hypothetical protein